MSPPATRRVRSLHSLAGGLIAAACLLARPAMAADVELAFLSLEDLMDLEVTLVSRRPERVSDVPAAIQVLTGDDLRRAGVRNLPEALRLVPGLQVARVDANKWAVSVRGFNNLFANKLLVLVDGRSVYTPVFSGVFWDGPDVALDDVERIEVIRGPGGTLWGANAVNGIINIVTLGAAQTQGTHVRLHAGSIETAGATVRHGARLGDDTWLRVYAKTFTRRAGEDSTGASLEDDWASVRAGARLETRRGVDRFVVDAGGYRGKLGQTMRVVTGLTPPYRFAEAVTSRSGGGHLLGRWERDLHGGGELSLQGYYDHWYRRDLPALAGELDILDVDLQHRRPLGRHRLAWGLGYRRASDDAVNTFTVTFTPERRTTHLWSGFAHVDIALHPGVLGASAGTKVEHNGHTGVEWQPGARLWWAPVGGQLLWLSWTHAVRTPARADDDMEAAARLTFTQVEPDSLLPTLVTQKGDPGLGAEHLHAMELGWRALLHHDVLLDAAVFVHRYNDLRTSEPTFPVLRPEPVRHLYLPLRAANGGGGTAAGLELSGTWQPTPRWRLSGGYAWLRLDLDIDADSADELFLTQEGENPRHTAHLRLQTDLSRRTELDVVARFVDALPAQGIPRYLTVDTRLGWRPLDGLELAAGGRNLLDAPHREFSPQVAVNVPGRVGAELYTTLAWQF